MFGIASECEIYFLKSFSLYYIVILYFSFKKNNSNMNHVVQGGANRSERRKRETIHMYFLFLCYCYYCFCFSDTFDLSQSDLLFALVFTFNSLTLPLHLICTSNMLCILLCLILSLPFEVWDQFEWIAYC